MKNFTLKLCLIFTILSICATSFADVVFKFKTPSDWSKCHIWAWDDYNTQLASTTDWPGDAAMTLGSDGYYTYTLKTSVTQVNFLFNNGASSGIKQTVDASTTKTKFMGRYGSTNTQGHYEIIEETYVDTDDSGDDDVVTPDNPQPTGEVTIAAIRNRLSINTNDFTDFAGLYVSALPKAGDATVSYEWQFSSNGTSWAKYSAGDGATWDNIRPNKAGYYRCVLSYDLEGVVTTFTSNTLQITNKGGNSVSFSSKLPVILVRTAKDFPTAGLLDNDGVAALKAKRSVDVKILWNEDGGKVTNSDINNADMLHYDRKARMNYRGSSSLRNPKKSYAFVTGDKNCDSKKLGEVKTKKFGMFGAEAQKDWVLYASYPDATYMRNVLTFHQYAKMTGLWGVKCRYVELYIDGSYQGIYVFMDKITQDENRVNVNEDTGFIVKFDKTDEVDSYDGTKGYNEDYKRNTFVTSNTGRRHISTYDQYVDQAFEIEYPEREDLAEFDDDGNLVDDSAWDAKVAEVKGLFTKMESAILANDYAKLATIIDYDSWADYFIMNEFSRNADAYRISCVFTVNSASDKIVANPMWDYELGWGNQDTQTTGLMVEDVKYYSDDFPTPFWWTGKGKSGCNGILGDCKFRAKVLERWEKHIGEDGALNSDVLNAKIDSLKTALSGSSTSASVSTSSLKSWVTNRTSGLNSEFNTWDACPDLKFALVGTINDEKLSTYASGIPFTMQDDGSYTAVFTASETTHNLQIIASTGDIWARIESKDIVSTDENASSYASMTKGQTTGYANITTVANTEYTFTFRLNADAVSGKLTYLKGNSVLPDPFVVIPTIKNLKCYNDYDGAISIEVSGSVAPYTYTWTYPNGTEVNTKDISGLRAGVYSLKIEDSVGLTYEATYEVTQPTEVVASIVGSTMVPYCNANGELTAELTGGVAPYTYKWTDGGVDNVLGTEQTLTNLAAGVYYLYAYDANGCLGYNKYVINDTEPLDITATTTNVKCYASNEGKIDIQVTGGTAPYTYSWKSEGFESSFEDIENLKAGVYTVTVLDANGCSMQKEISVTQPEKLVSELISGGTIPYCKSIGELTFDVTGGVAPYTYELHKGSIYGEIVSTSSEAFNLEADAYYAYVYDANGCRAYTKQIINSTEELRLIINSVIEPSEYGAKDGSIDITITGGLEPYTYEWRGTDFNSSSEDVSGLGADIYKIIVTDANDCLVNDAIELKQPAPKPFVVTPTIKNLKCYNDYDGAISLEVSGSVAPYTYTWTYPNGTEVNTKDISGLTAGVYTLRIEDSIGEIYEETYEITEPEKLNAELISGGTIPYCKSIGELTFDVTGGVAPYTYELHKGSIYGEIVSTSSEAFNLEADAYYAYVYDANGCRAYTKQIINSTEELRLIINSVIEPSEYGAKDGSIDITITGGLEPYTYEWRGTDFNSSSEDVSGLGADIYKIIVTDANDCLVNDAIELKQPEKVKYNYFTVLLDGDCYGEYTFSEDNDNRILFTEEVESSNLKTYTIIANCDASIFENNIYVLLEEAGVYDVEIIFNGDYETPNFTYNVTKKSITTEVQDIESDVIINVEKGLISVYNREFSIYNVIGQNVTVYNGSLLPGVYMVQIGDVSKKVIMK